MALPDDGTDNGHKSTPVLSIDQGKWSEQAQAGELAFHKRPNFRTNDEGFSAGNKSFWEGLGYTSDMFHDKVVIDIGAGSRLRGKFFEGAKLVSIEPLADQFIKDIKWCDLNQSEVHSIPAEEFVDSLEQMADFVFSVNVLDHCYDFVKIVNNIYRYLKPGGTALLSFDCHHRVDALHPIIVNESIASEIFINTGFVNEKYVRTSSYHKSIAVYAATFWLKRYPVQNRMVALSEMQHGEIGKNRTSDQESTADPLQQFKSLYPLFWRRRPIKNFPVTDKIFARLDSVDVERAHRIITEEIMDPAELSEILNAANGNKYKYKTSLLTYANHFRSDHFNKKTLMSAANPPADVPSMTRQNIFCGDLYAPDVLVETLEECGITITDGLDILDFGCSSARVSRNLYAAYPQTNWWGCDPQAPAVKWAQENFPSLKLSINNESPPLEYPDSKFDGSFAFSIWSHFNEAVAVEWLDEIHRVTKKNGFLFLTTCGMTTIETLIKRHPPQWSKERIRNVFSQLVGNGFFFEETYSDTKNFALDTKKYGMAYFIPDWIMEYIPGKWALLNYKAARSGHQDAYVLRKV